MFSSLENCGKAETEPSRYSQETCQLFLHYKIGLRVIVGAKLYHFCIAFHLIFLHGILPDTAELPETSGLYPRFRFSVFPRQILLQINHQHCFNAVTQRL